MNYARMAIAKATSKVPAAAYFPGGSVVAEKFEAQLMLFEKFGGVPTQGTLKAVTGQTVPVFNIHDKDIEAGELLVIGQTIDETWVVECVY